MERLTAPNSSVYLNMTDNLPTIPIDTAGGNYFIGGIITNPDSDGANNDSSGADAASLTVVAPGPLLGDVNCDGVDDILDVAPFIEILSSAQYDEKADVNQDGVINLLDVDPFVAILNGN